MKISRHAFIKAIAGIAGLTGLGAIKGIGKKEMFPKEMVDNGKYRFPNAYLGDEFKVGDTFTLSWEPGRIYTVTDTNSTNEIKTHLSQ